MRLRLLTYNIHKGIGGVDRKYSLERIVDVIQHYSPDVALLQEVDDGVPRSRRDRQIDLLAERLGFAHSAFQRNVKFVTEDTETRFSVKFRFMMSLTWI